MPLFAKLRDGTFFLEKGGGGGGMENLEKKRLQGQKSPNTLFARDKKGNKKIVCKPTESKKLISIMIL